MKQRLNFQRKTVRVIGLAGLLALAAIFVYWPEKDDSLNVPLGVEQAAIITYSGPNIAVQPYKWGVAVNIRIAKVTAQPDARIYDVRYIVNRAGTFDLKDYLIGEDGSPLDGLPSFKFHGDPKLSKHLDARIQETEEFSVEVDGYYYATLIGLGIFWVIWLLLLIFYGRAKPPQQTAVADPAPTLAEMLRALLGQLEAGTLDVPAKAKLEVLLLRRWREDLALADASMSDALEAIGRSEKIGPPLRQLQHWLHHPASNVRREEIVEIIAPYTKEPRKPEDES